MKRILLLLFTFLAITMEGFSQANCANPKNVNICPSMNYIHETNAGMGNDAPAGCNIAGEDLVYKISAPHGADKIYVSIRNASGPFQISMFENSCSNGTGNSYQVPTGNSNYAFTVASVSQYFLWVDAATTVTYDISIGGDTGSIVLNTNNTQGNFSFDSSGCATPLFSMVKPFYQVSYNNVYMTNPMTLSPLNVPGNVCVSVFLKNKTGIESLKRIRFDFCSGYTNISGPPQLHGFYNAGIWTPINNGNTWMYEFFDSLGMGKGDFITNPDSCMSYEFCFNVKPVTNNIQLTNVNVSILSDGFGAAFNGTWHNGCCPQLISYCMNTGAGGPINSTHAFNFGFADPGNPLPIQLINFSAEMANHFARIRWSTATEVNNDYFTIQKSHDAIDWSDVKQVDGAGTTSSLNSYELTDAKPYDGISYYRLRQTDFDGTNSFSEIVIVRNDNRYPVYVYPNPASNRLNVEVDGNEFPELTLDNMLGDKISCPVFEESGHYFMNTADVPDGIYMLIIKQDEAFEVRKIVIQHK